MTKSLAMKWVRNLRSKKFKQAQMHLRVRDNEEVIGYCCLGVLGEICGISPEYLDDNETLNDPKVRKHCQIYNDEGIPREGMVKLRIGNSFAQFTSLAVANDKGASFRSIASWIEKNYKRL